MTHNLVGWQISKVPQKSSVFVIFLIYHHREKEVCTFCKLSFLELLNYCKEGTAYEIIFCVLSSTSKFDIH